jgi:hypothetical protein
VTNRSNRRGITLAAADRRLAQAAVTLREPAEAAGFVNAHPMAHHRWMPSIEKGSDTMAPLGPGLNGQRGSHLHRVRRRLGIPRYPATG